ncbi:hypothetical protein BGLA2_1000004 [Burkholderia gladioli]|nr:hypothetical protein BGLA2_1000004 [Burkholderia gladioli]
MIVDGIIHVLPEIPIDPSRVSNLEFHRDQPPATPDGSQRFTPNSYFFRNAIYI